MLVFFFSPGTMLVKQFATLLILSTTVCAYPGVPSKIAALMYNWAPLVKIAQNELWHPSGVDYFLSHTRFEGCSSQPNPWVLTIYNLEKCNGLETATSSPKKALAALPAPNPFFSVVNIQV